MEPNDLNAPEIRNRAVKAARGDAPFDLLIVGARVVDVALGEVRKADVGIVGPLIASVHRAGSRTDCDRVLESGGNFLAPGLIDCHMHIESSMIVPSEYASAVLARGTTTVVWDPHEFANVAGVAGFEYSLAQAAASPLRILLLVPSCVPSAPGYEVAGAEFDSVEISRLLERGEVVGLAEVMDMAGVIGQNTRMNEIVLAGLSSGKPVFGHARGLSGPDLQAYIASGISSDHELTDAADLEEKLRSGITVELRGSHPYLLPEFARVLQELPACPPNLTLCTDDVFPDDLLKFGALDEVLRKLVRYGLDPVRALQAGTLNAAVRLGRPDLGLIAPGKRADIVIFDNLEDFGIVEVLCSGRAPGTSGKGAVEFPDSPRMEKLSSRDFELSAVGPVTRIATIDNPRFTSWGEVRLTVTGEFVNVPKGITRIAVIHRHGRAHATPRLGLLRGWGSWKGAFATTVSHDSHNLTVFGNDTTDMARAANALIESNGGMAVARAGELVARLELPVAGLVSNKSLAEVAVEFTCVKDSMESIVEWQKPYLTFKALVGATLACNAGPHQTDQGIADPLNYRLEKSPVVEDGILA